MLKRIRSTAVLVAAMVLAGAAFAQTATITPREDRGYQPMRGTSNVGLPVATLQACVNVIKAAALSRRKTELYKCRHETVHLATFSSAPPPVVCEAAPAPTAAVIACTPPLVGQWTQTTTVAIGPAPTCTRTITLSTQPPGACTEPNDPPPDPGPVTTNTYYITPTGNDANPGTQASPKRTFSGAWLSGLPASSRVCLTPGATYASGLQQILNTNTSEANPLVIETCGQGSPAVITGTLEFTKYPWTTPHGGYVLRNLISRGTKAAYSVDIGVGGGPNGAGRVTSLILDNVVVEDWAIAINANDYMRKFVMRNSTIRNNVQHGLLGAGDDWVIENNTFSGNGDARPPGTHAVYFSSGSFVASNLTVRGNTFTNNSQVTVQVNGQSVRRCASGNLTVHGRIVGALIENNRIESDGSVGGCRAISLTAGYGSQEYMRQFVVRGNRTYNAGAGVAYSASPGILIENNNFVDNQGQGWALIERATNSSGGGDDADGGEVIRNNTLCQRADCTRP
jgi:hypothetical protein